MGAASPLSQHSPKQCGFHSFPPKQWESSLEPHQELPMSSGHRLLNPQQFPWEFMVLCIKWENLGEVEHRVCMCFAHISAKYMYLQSSLHFVRVRNISLWSVKQVNKIEREIYTVSACLYTKITIFSVVQIACRKKKCTRVTV